MASCRFFLILLDALIGENFFRADLKLVEILDRLDVQFVTAVRREILFAK